jgi:uncharacterized membrane protein
MMSDASVQSPPRAPMLRRLQIALAISVALNLFVVGIVAGAMLHRENWDARGAMTRELGFGPFSGALGKPERDALRQYLQERAPQLRAANAQRGREIAAVQAALRAEPFDPEALRAALAAMEQRQTGQLKLGYEAIFDVFAKMPPDQRRALADRLEDRGGDRGGERAKGGGN